MIRTPVALVIVNVAVPVCLVESLWLNERVLGLMWRHTVESGSTGLGVGVGVGVGVEFPFPLLLLSPPLPLSPFPFPCGVGGIGSWFIPRHRVVLLQSAE